ncbi:MAG: alpha/beta fold hydrolase [Leptospiraceae bacterium]|nr:alpha/beta fold hydrolase [Leptospiraceae bacterium]
MNIFTKCLITWLGIAALAFVACRKSDHSKIILVEQGSFAVGGKVITISGTFDPIKQGAYNPSGPDSKGQSLHGDHAYVFYQIPEKARKLPLVFWHGYGQSSKTWESTPDGREGFQNIFLRRNYSVYLLDQPRRGKAGKSTVASSLPLTPDEQLWFGIFRIGLWPDYYKNVAFPRDKESLNQFFRQAVPSPDSFDNEVLTSAVSALFEKIGNGILVTHSASGTPGWLTAVKNNKVRAIVSFEPGMNFPFPEGVELPEPVAFNNGKSFPFMKIPPDAFDRLTKIPIVIYFGDNIPEKATSNPGQDQWRVYLATARIWAKIINSRGGDATIVHLPEIGIKGNTHFLFADMNNLEIADQMSKWLKEKGLN